VKTTSTLAPPAKSASPPHSTHTPSPPCEGDVAEHWTTFRPTPEPQATNDNVSFDSDDEVTGHAQQHLEPSLFSSPVHRHAMGRVRHDPRPSPFSSPAPIPRTTAPVRFLGAEAQNQFLQSSDVEDEDEEHPEETDAFPPGQAETRPPHIDFRSASHHLSHKRDAHSAYAPKSTVRRTEVQQHSQAPSQFRNYPPPSSRYSSIPGPSRNTGQPSRSCPEHYNSDFQRPTMHTSVGYNTMRQKPSQRDVVEHEESPRPSKRQRLVFESEYREAPSRKGKERETSCR
jgi:hypothetical protein